MKRTKHSFCTCRKCYWCQKQIYHFCKL